MPPHDPTKFPEFSLKSQIPLAAGKVAAATPRRSSAQRLQKAGAMTGISSPARTTGHQPALIRVRNILGSLRKAALSAFRIVVSFLFACHGALTLFGLFGGVDGGGSTAPIGSWPTWWAGVIELVAGGLVFLGLFARPAALLCSGSMAFAYFTVHQPKGLLPLQNHGEPAVLYCWAFLLIALLGPGSYALDVIFQRRRTARRPTPIPPVA